MALALMALASGLRPFRWCTAIHYPRPFSAMLNAAMVTPVTAL